jgi:hypothetical protein
MQTHNSTCSYVWVWNFVTYIKDAVENNWTSEGVSIGRLEKNA